jgi:DNA-binding NarL/FixJ family response regulator
MPPIRISVLASSDTVRAGLESLLAPHPDLRVVAGNPRRAGAGVDVLVVAEGRGLKASDREAAAGKTVVCLSDDPNAAARLASAGPPAWALLRPGAGGGELAAAVRAVHQGLVVLGQPLASGWFPSRPASESPSGEGPRLTPREREVLELLARGLGNKQIAWELSVSEHTVKYHVSALYAKLGAGSRTEVLRLGIERGLLTL